MTTTETPPPAMVVTGCVACGQPVVKVMTEGRRLITIHPTPDTGGTVTLNPDGTAHILTGNQLPALETAYIDHRRICRRSPGGPRCVVCKGHMDPDLTAEEHWTCHPSCDPTAYTPRRTT
jgi:hypothetical protein